MNYQNELNIIPVIEKRLLAEASRLGRGKHQPGDPPEVGLERLARAHGLLDAVAILRAVLSEAKETEALQ